MYQTEVLSALVASRRKLLGARRNWNNVGRTVFLLGVTSLLTDISAEMVSTTLPLYLLVTLRFSPFQVGVVDGIYQGASVLVNVASGFVADRWRKQKEVAAAGYGLSALCKLGFLVVGSNWTGIATTILIDRTGKGIRTAPRDAMIAATTSPEQRGTAFGIHRAMDTAGAMIGPLLAMAILTIAQDAYDAIFVVSLCIALIGLAVIVLFVSNPDTDAENSGPAKRETISGRDVSALMQRVDFRSVVVLGSALALVTVSDNLLYLSLRQRMSIPTALFPALYVVTALIFMVAAVPVGRLADRIGHRLVFVLGYGLLAGAYVILLLPQTGFAGAGCVFICLGLFYAATDGVLAALASGTLPANLRTTGLALLATGTGLARLLASTMYGTLWSTFGPQAAVAVFWTGLVAMLVVSGFTIHRVGRR